MRRGPAYRGLAEVPTAKSKLDQPKRAEFMLKARYFSPKSDKIKIIEVGLYYDLCIIIIMHIHISVNNINIHRLHSDPPINLFISINL